ncbi:MAG TPA: SPFH domain-containing protein [Longimicrobiales bacterium]|nr:SPFH domain-containing protein [Longimicrobiales bacterium]
MVREVPFKASSGWAPLFLCLGAIAGAIALIIFAASTGQPLPWVPLAVVLFFTGLICLFGLMAIAPNDARVLLLFGDYRGSIKESGFFWVNPFFSKKKVTLRVRNFETGGSRVEERKDAAGQVTQAGGRSSGRPSKVNDRDGNPIDISAVVVWRVVDTAEALLEVDDYEDYVAIQSESALRNLASRHPYDSGDDEVSLRGNTDAVCDQLRTDIQERMNQAGVEVIESRISHLAYSAEIAASMLQRQQAHAVVAARARIVEGAVGIVQMALADLEKSGTVDLDDERRASMVSNLLVVLCSNAPMQPVINTGTLYQ